MLFRSLPILAIRRMRGNWRLLSSVVVGTIVAATVLSSTAIYADAIRDLGLDFAFEASEREELDVRITQGNVSIRPDSYEASRQRMEAAVAASLRSSLDEVIRQGSSATFFPSGPGAAFDAEDDGRPRANLRFRDGIEEHVQLVAGNSAPEAPAGWAGAIPVVIGAETAQRNGLSVGERLDLHPFWDEDVAPLEVEIVGIVEPIDLTDPYWGGDPYIVDDRERTWQTFILLVPRETLFGAALERLPSLRAFYADRYIVELEGLNARNAEPVANSLLSLQRRLAVSDSNVTVRTKLGSVLEDFDERLFFVRIPLFVLLLQVGGIVAYYLVMVSTMLVERQSAEIATLRSRGATTTQLLALYGIEGLILAVVAAATGPPIAAAAISALGPTPPFADLSGGAPLDVTITRLSYALAVGGALLAFAAFMLPAWMATRSTVVEFKRAAARPRRTPLLLRYYVDVAFVIVLAIVFWRLRQADALFEDTVFGETRADPILMATPAVVMVTVGILFIRLFPLALRLAAVFAARIPSPAVLVSIRSLSRDPTHYSRLILMLMFATGVGLFGATFSATLDRSYEDRARYLVGADVRVADLRGLGGAGDRVFRAAIEDVPADAISLATRSTAIVSANGKSISVRLLGIDPDSFEDVGYFRDDFADDNIAQIVESLAETVASQQLTSLPDDAQQIGVWMKLSDIRGPMAIAYSYEDGNGRSGAARLGSVRPGDPATEEWRFFSADLFAPRSIFSGVPHRLTLQAPITVRSVFVVTRSAIAAQRGVVHFGPVLTTAEPSPIAPGDPPPEPQEREFLDAMLAHELTPPAFEVIQGTRGAYVGDLVQLDSDAPPGFASSGRYEWLDTDLTSRERGLRPLSDARPIPFYLSADHAELLALSPGDSAEIRIAGTHQPATYLGSFDLFPTFDPQSSRDGFAVANATRIAANTNASLPSVYVQLNEAWFRTSDAAATIAALGALDAQVIRGFEDELLRQEDDPLIGAGWEGILAISFFAVLLLTAIGFVVYSYLTSQQRGLEFAILQTLGFSRRQVFLVVLIEHAFVIIAGVGLGTIVGLQVGFFMMDLFEIDEQGRNVVPPFALAVSWPQVLLVWGVLAVVFTVTIGAVVLRYFGLALHRALRVGDP